MLDNVRRIWTNPSQNTWKNIEESFTYFSASIELDSLTENDVDSLSNFLSSHLEYQDTFNLKIFYDTDESIEFSNITSTEKTEQKLEDLKNEILILSDNDYSSDGIILSVELKIYKKSYETEEHVIIDNVYSLDALSFYLNSLTLTELHSAFSKRYGCKNTKGVVLVGDYSTSAHSDFFYFIPKNQFEINKFKSNFSNIRADEIYRIRGSLSHFANASEWFFLPDHFKLNKIESSEFDTINSLFNALHNTYLISFLSNFSIVKEQYVEYRLKGLKDITASYSFGALKNIDANELWKLYQWIYAGNTIDKLGVTRYIIPLHAEDLLSVNSSASASAYSSFMLSQKEDVKSYIETTKKIAEQIQITSQKASEVAEKIANSIKTGVLGITTFAISTLLFRIFTKGSELKSYSDLFSFIGSPLFSSMIIFALAIFSGLFGLAWFESRQDQSRFQDMYNEFKETYSTVLTHSDMNNLLKDDAYFIKNNDFITKRRSIYTITWGFVVIISVIILLLARCYVKSQAGS